MTDNTTPKPRKRPGRPQGARKQPTADEPLVVNGSDSTDWIESNDIVAFFRDYAARYPEQDVVAFHSGKGMSSLADFFGAPATPCPADANTSREFFRQTSIAIIREVLEAFAVNRVEAPARDQADVD